MVGGEGRKVPASEVVESTTFTITVSGAVTQLYEEGELSSTVSLILRSWKEGGDNGVIYVGWEDDDPSEFKLSAFPLSDGESISLDIDASQQPIYALTTKADSELKVLATN